MVAAAIQPTDEALLKELCYSHSERTILHRYFTLIRPSATPAFMSRYGAFCRRSFRRERLRGFGRWATHPRRWSLTLLPGFKAELLHSPQRDEGRGSRRVPERKLG